MHTRHPAAIPAALAPGGGEQPWLVCVSLVALDADWKSRWPSLLWCGVNSSCCFCRYVCVLRVLWQLTLPFVLDVCLQLTSGVRHLHANEVLHRDLKCDNALVASVAPLVVKWSDFGCSVKITATAFVHEPSKAGSYGSSTRGECVMVLLVRVVVAPTRAT